MIFNNPNESKMKATGFSKLDGMARHIMTQAEETPPNSSIS